MLAVFDTNVLVSGLRSARGASNAVLQRVALGHCKAAISTALLLEYEDVLNRPGLLAGYSPGMIATFLDSFCSGACESFIYFRWRPFRADPGDDLVFECALASGATHIVTHNGRDFKGTEDFGVSAVTPADFLAILPAI